MRATRIVLMVALVSTAAPLRGQDGNEGVMMPVTVTGGLLVSDRPKADGPDATRVAPGFRAVVYPSLKISRGWSIRSAVQIQSSPFFYYEDFYADKEFETQVQQLFVAYNWTGER